MKAYTDYPFVFLGDEEGQPAPIREVVVLSYDGDKYCRIHVDGVLTDVKSGYLYSKSGRCGKVPKLSRRVLHSLKEKCDA